MIKKLIYRKGAKNAKKTMHVKYKKSISFLLKTALLCALCVFAVKNIFPRSDL